MNDATAGVAWLLANALLVSTAWKWHRRLFPEDGMGPGIIHTVVMCWAGVVVVGIAVGALGVLTPGLLLAGVCLLCLLARLLARHAAKDWPRNVSCKLIGPFDRSSRPWAICWGVLGALLLARVILDGLLAFPTDWDTLAYHLPLIDHWIREGTLYVPDCPFWYCPGNNELLGLWFVAPFSGDFLIALNNLPTVVLLAAATVELARLLNVSRPLCHLAAMAVVATEVTWRQAISAENDIAMAALFFATLVYGLRFARRRSKADMWLAGIAVGLLTGVKYVAVGYAAAAGVSLLLLLALRRRQRDAFAAAAVGITGVLVFGAYWYLRNAYFTGAPLYPKGFTESTDLWARIRPGSHTSTLLWSGRTEVWPLYAAAVRKAAGTVHLAAIGLLPSVILWIGAGTMFDRRRNRRRQQTRLWLWLVIVLAAGVCLLTPNVVETVAGTMNMLRLQYHSVRLSLPFLSLCVVALAVPLSDVSKMLRVQASRSAPATHREWPQLSPLLGVVRKTLWLLVVGVAVAVVGHQVSICVWKDLNVDLLVTDCDVFLLGVLLAWTLPAILHDRRKTVLAGFALLVGVAWGCALSSTRWHAEFSRFYNGYFGSAAFSSLTRVNAEHERLCICDNRYYPFFGSRREVNVCRPLWLPDYPAFLHYVEDSRATIVVTRTHDSHDQRRYVHVADWLSNHPDEFETIERDHVYTWARVIRSDEGRHRSSHAAEGKGHPHE